MTSEVKDQFYKTVDNPQKFMHKKVSEEYHDWFMNQKILKLRVQIMPTQLKSSSEVLLQKNKIGYLTTSEVNGYEIQFCCQSLKQYAVKIS